MLFNSIEFILFFVAVYAVYLTLKGRGQNLFLLFASYAFYAAWDARFLALIVGTTLIDFFCGKKLSEASSQSRKKLLLAVSLTANLGTLAVFKYLDFFVGSFTGLLASLGFSIETTTLNILLPVGISFYTFQTMSYTIDIYRGKLTPVTRFSDFALYVAFFPQLIAGPIERARRFLPQITGKRTITSDGIHQGLWLLLLGYYQKVYIADNLATLVNPLFADSSTSGALVLLATYGFAFQIYCDFAGYSNIARGLAKLMGFDLVVNFNSPYFAISPSDFWKRWHISLSTWLRDYLYIPLGGSRGSSWFTMRNLLITMLLGGLWHGAAGHFLVWGLYHGILLALYHAYRKKFSLPETLLSKSISIVVTFHLICLGWLFFRAETTGQAFTMLGSLTQFKIAAGLGLSGFVTLAIYVTPLLLLDFVLTRRELPTLIESTPWWVRSAACTACCLSILLAGRFSSDEFLYFQF